MTAHYCTRWPCPICNAEEAEITALKAEIERLRVVLERIADKTAFDSSLELKAMARKALAQVKE